MLEYKTVILASDTRSGEMMNYADLGLQWKCKLFLSGRENKITGMFIFNLLSVGG